MPVKRAETALGPENFLINASGQRLLIWEPQCLLALARGHLTLLAAVNGSPTCQYIVPQSGNTPW